MYLDKHTYNIWYVNMYNVWIETNYVPIKIHLQHISPLHIPSQLPSLPLNNLSTSVALQGRCQQQRGLNLRPKTSADFQPPGSWGKESGETIFTFTKIHSLKLTARELPLKIGVNATHKKNFHLPTIDLHGRAVSFREGKWTCCPKQIPIFTITPSVWNLGVFGGIITVLNRGGT